MASSTLRPWRTAMGDALYGPAGFFRTHAPRDHFRTSSHASGLFAAALLRLAADHGLRRVVDVGAGSGELLATMYELNPELELIAVELAAHPTGLPDAIAWRPDLPDEVDGLIVANEWLDNVPLDVVEVDEDGVPRLVLVQPDGSETLGDPVHGRDRDWLTAWWPISEPGERAEIGWPRDDAWADCVRRLRHGLAVAIDYAHTADARPSTGTLTGYRSGRQVPPVPDGSCDLTAHVAIDACAAAVSAAGQAGGTPAHNATDEPGDAMIDEVAVLTQRAAIRSLLPAPVAPDRELARESPATYLAALSRVGEHTELCDPTGLGGHRWLIHSRGIPLDLRTRHNGR